MFRTAAVSGSPTLEAAVRAASPATASERFASIDTLRGIACLLVVHVHSVHWLQDTHFSVGPWLQSLMHWSTVSIDAGKVGVLIFFAISGYVVPFSLLRQRKSPVRDFLISRFFRLYPIYWLSIIIGIPVVYYFLGYPNSFRTFVANLTMVHPLFGEPHVLRIYWTLQVELLFYTLCVIMFVLGGMRYVWAPGVISMALLLLALPLAGLRHVLEKEVPVGLALALSLMFFGFAVRQFAVHRTAQLRQQVNLLIALYAVLFPVICYTGYASVQGTGTWTSYLLSYYLATAVFVAVALVWPMSTRVTAWAGRVSYSVYLFHLLCIHVLGYYFLRHLPGGVPGALFLIVFPVASLIVSHLLYTYVEQPSIRLGRAINRRLG